MKTYAIVFAFTLNRPDSEFPDKRDPDRRGLTVYVSTNLFELFMFNLPVLVISIHAFF